MTRIDYSAVILSEGKDPQAIALTFDTLEDESVSKDETCGSFASAQDDISLLKFSKPVDVFITSQPGLVILNHGMDHQFIGLRFFQQLLSNGNGLINPLQFAG